MGVMFGEWLYAKRHPHPAPTRARQEADPSLRNLPPSRGKEAQRRYAQALTLTRCASLSLSRKR